MPEFEKRQNPNRSDFLAQSAGLDRSMPKPAHDDNPLLAPQQALGNQAMLQFAQSCPISLPNASICPFGGVCHTCPARVQTKLKISQPGDKYEREADRIAKQVMSMPDLETGEHVTTCGQSEEIQLQRSCLKCEEKLSGLFIDEKKHAIQRDTVPGYIPEIPSYMATRLKTIQDNGQPLPESVRVFFEPRFGYDFSQVRVHTDVRAAETANALDARALTMGPDIVFGSGHYKPDTAEGKKLLAHELTHVIQQGRSEKTTLVQRRLFPTQSMENILEIELNRANLTMMRDEQVEVSNRLPISSEMLSLNPDDCPGLGQVIVECGIPLLACIASIIATIATSPTGLGLVAGILAIIATCGGAGYKCTEYIIKYIECRGPEGLTALQQGGGEASSYEEAAS